ncbi:MAG: GDP-mannose 4,6-dehydratase [Chloroflexota bacterium]
MTYLVTGGAGFIGSHISESLLARGEDVVIIDDFNDYYDPQIKRNNIERIQNDKLFVIEGDIRDAKTLNDIFASHSITHIAHMAARSNVRASMNQTPLYMAVNTIGTMNLLEVAVKHDVQQLVMASTSSVYGSTEVIPFVETDSADRPLASYPASKRAAEILAHTYYNLHGLNTTVLRFFNVYGPAGRPDMMPMRLLHATQTGKQMTLFNGGDISRDWTYIGDTVRGVVAALDTPLGYEVINLGVGDPISLRDFVEIIEDVSGKEINKIAVETPPSDPPITYCDNTKARELLGFVPSISVQEGLAKTWAWFSEYYQLTP